MLKVAFIGAGAVADLHADSIRQVDGLDFVGVHDVRPDVAAAKARAWKVRHFASLDAILDDRSIDAVFVLTHVDSHLDIASRAIAAGKHVFLEKPVSDDAGGIDKLAGEARAKGLVCMPDHNYAYVPEFRRLKRLVDQGDLGTIRSFFVIYVIPHAEELASHYGGVLEEVMIHHSYLSLSILGKPDRVVAGVARPAWKKHTAEDQAWMVWDYERGASAHLFGSFATDDLTNEPWTCLVKVLGTNGSAVVNWRSAIFQRARGTHAMAWDQYEQSFTDTMQVFRDAVVARGPIASTLDDAATAARIIREAYVAARSHIVVSRTAPDGTVRW
jgi:predicted dehydrogenase